MNKRSLGTEYEHMTENYLKEFGVRIVEKNFRNRFGEIDLIGYDGEYLVFFEVKFRRDEGSGSGEDAVGIKKRHTICKVSDYYRMLNGIGEFTPIRYDVIAINGDRIRWIKDAFAYC
ncbi:MAG: YraN family protein [Lachnospiraceae bacterium]|nr:YraN family protein [Lachnospiraceae bacterium]